VRKNWLFDEKRGLAKRKRSDVTNLHKILFFPVVLLANRCYNGEKFMVRGSAPERRI
jgi:hypothetical protein